MNSLPSFHSVLCSAYLSGGCSNFSNNPSADDQSSCSHSSLYENFYGNSEFSDISLESVPGSSSEVHDLPQVPLELQFDEIEYSDVDTAALLLVGIASASRNSEIEGEQPSKRPRLARYRSHESGDDSFYPESYSSSLLLRSDSSAEESEDSQTISYNLSKDPRALLGISMLLTNTLPPNIDSMGLADEDLRLLKYFASIKALAVAIREGNEVVLVISELFDKVIYKYINTNEKSLQLQSQGGRFRYWPSASGELLGTVKNQSKHHGFSVKKIVRTFAGVDSPENVFFQFPNRFSQEVLGNIIYQTVSSFIKDINATEERLISKERIGSSTKAKFAHVKSVKEHFLQLASMSAMTSSM